MPGVISSVTTRRRSMPTGEPEKSRYGMRNLVLRPAQIDSGAQPKPSQAEGDRSTIEESLREKEV